MSKENPLDEVEHLAQARTRARDALAEAEKAHAGAEQERERRAEVFARARKGFATEALRRAAGRVGETVREAT